MAMMSEPGLRNLDQLQEEEDRGTPRAVTAGLLVLGGACVVFAALALGGRSTATHTVKSDPLGELVSKVTPPVGSVSSRVADLAPRDVTFPQMLSDDPRPTTALAAVRSGAASAQPSASSPARGREASASPSLVIPEPPPATDRLPVVPLPAQTLLEATPVVTRPRDALTKAATDAAQITTPPPSSEAAAPGHEGGYQLQVSSFQAHPEAEGFAAQLRARGHHAYVVEAHVPGRGTWYRVRIGPFSNQRAALQYRAAFEAREHVVPFVVIPDASPKPQ